MQLSGRAPLVLILHTPPTHTQKQKATIAYKIANENSTEDETISWLFEKICEISRPIVRMVRKEKVQPTKHLRKK